MSRIQCNISRTKNFFNWKKSHCHNSTELKRPQVEMNLTIIHTHERSLAGMRNQMTFDMFRSSEQLAAALKRTAPLLLSIVHLKVPTESAWCWESPVASFDRASVRTFPSVASHVLLQTTQLVKLATTSVECTDELRVMLMNTSVWTDAHMWEKCLRTSRKWTPMQNNHYKQA